MDGEGVELKSAVILLCYNDFVLHNNLIWFLYKIYMLMCSKYIIRLVLLEYSFAYHDNGSNKDQAHIYFEYISRLGPNPELAIIWVLYLY